MVGNRLGTELGEGGCERSCGLGKSYAFTLRTMGVRERF